MGCGKLFDVCVVTPCLSDDFSLSDVVAEFEQVLLLEALEACNHNISDTARLVGINRTTLSEKLRLYQIVVRKSKKLNPDNCYHGIKLANCPSCNGWELTDA